MKVEDIHQADMPYVEALEAYREEGFVPFHTPGHKIGHGAPAHLQTWMKESLAYDLGVMYALDDLHEPEGAFREAQELAAHLYGADRAWYSVNGTTALIMTMIMATVGEGDTIIIPREAHKSVMSGLIMSGARPVYLPSRFNYEWGIQEGASLDDLRLTLEAHLEAKAVLLVYPNYYGVGVDIEAMVGECHKRGVLVLVDEAHGPHFPFDDRLPIEAIAAGADLVAQSTHKSLGSLTQTSTLLGQGQRIDYRRITQVHQMFQSTSPNYIFMASLDMARQQMALDGKRLVGQAVDLSLALREAISKIPGIQTMDGSKLSKNFDPTKVLIDARELGLDAVSFEQKLREHKIEVELIQACHVLVTITIGDSQESIDALVAALMAISQDVLGDRREEHVTMTSLQARRMRQQDLSLVAAPLPQPKVIKTPRQGFYAERERVSLSQAEGRLCGETITYYPPGIPVVGIGEEITAEVLAYIQHKQAQGYEPNGAEDMSLETILVVKE